MKRALLYLIFAFLFPNQTICCQSTSIADCDGAIPIFNGYYDLPSIPFYPIGEVPNEVNANFSCLSSGEINGIWFEFMILDSGVLSFNIIPYDPSDDYDWGLYNLTNSNCAAIHDSAILELRCNYSNSITNGGITGANGGSNNQDEPTLFVTSGQLFKLFISNYSASTSGFQINMGASSCTFDQTVGLNENSLKGNIKLAPNPTTGPLILTIPPDLLKDITSLKIVDLQGKILQNHCSGFSPLMPVNLSNYPAGLYFLQISTSSEQHSIKIILE